MPKSKTKIKRRKKVKGRKLDRAAKLVNGQRDRIRQFKEMIQKQQEEIFKQHELLIDGEEE